MSSRNNPEMSQHSSDVPMLVNSELGCIIENINSPSTTMLIKGQKLLTNRKLSEFFDVSAGCRSHNSYCICTNNGQMITSDMADPSTIYSTVIARL